MEDKIVLDTKRVEKIVAGDDPYFRFSEDVDEQFFRFPFGIMEGVERDLLNFVIMTTQDAIAEEFTEMEPELRYYNEWTEPEVFQEFVDYVAEGIAEEATQDIFDKVFRRSFQKRYERLVKEGSVRDFKALRERAKKAVSDNE